MPDSEFERRLRRAFSYREKARQLERECARAYDAGEIESERYASLREFYAHHIRSAEHEVATVRQAITARRQAFLEQFRSVDAAQATLGDRLNAGRIKPEKANRENRRLMGDANACRKAMAACDRLLEASTAEQVGGFLDWPLTSFQPAKSPEEEKQDTAFEWERALAYALPFLLAASVFLPWLTLEGASKSLAALGDFGSVLGLPAMLGPMPARLIWVVFLLLPLIALPFAAMSRNRPSGHALVVSGFLLIWMLGGAVLVLPSLAMGPAVTLGTVIRGLHLGPFVYFGGAIGMILLGRRRSQRTEASNESGGRAVIIMSACMIFLMVVAGSAVWFQSHQGFVAFSSRVVDDRTGAVNILLANEGRVPALVHAPWPGGVPGRESASTEGDVYGITLYVRERGAENFQLLPEARGAWLYAGLPIRDEAPIVAPPRSRLVVTLAPWQLQALGVDPAAVRLVFSRRNGEELARFEHEMPELRAEPAQPPMPVSPRVITGTAAPDRPVPDIDETNADTGTSIAATSQPQAEPEGTRVAFTGIIGNQAILQVAPPGEPPTRVMVGADDLISGNWVLLEISAAPPGLTLFNERSYESVSLRMGESANLP